MAKKIYITAVRVRLNGSNTTTVWCGTIDEMNNNIFGYSLECGKSWDNKVNRYPKTAKSLVTNLNRASAASCRQYQDCYYSLSTPEEIAVFNANCSDDCHSYRITA